MKMVSKEQARLYYKNAIVKKIYLISYIFLGIFGILYALFAGISLIVENKTEPSSTFLYFALGIGLFSLVVAIILLCFALIGVSDSMSIFRAQAIFGIKLFLRILNLLSGIYLLVIAFATNVGFDVSNDSWGYFVRGFALFVSIVEGVMCLYNFWNLAWRKENPERFSVGLYIKKIENIDKEDKKKKKEKKETKPVVIKEKEYVQGEVVEIEDKNQ